MLPTDPTSVSRELSNSISNIQDLARRASEARRLGNFPVETELNLELRDERVGLSILLGTNLGPLEPEKTLAIRQAVLQTATRVEAEAPAIGELEADLSREPNVFRADRQGRILESQRNIRNDLATMTREIERGVL